MKDSIRAILAAWLVGGALAGAAVAGPEGEQGVYDIPRVDAINIDGDGADWGDRGFCVDLMTDQQGVVRPEKDFDPRFRLAWDERGLIVLITVRDNQPVEHDYERHLFLKDSIELFIGSAVGDPDYYMLVISPGMDPRYPQVRRMFFDERLETPTPVPRAKPLQATVSRRSTDGGYVMEVLLPWANLGVEPTAGQRLAFQFYAMDRDSENEDTYVATWYPAADTHLHQTTSMYTLRLADAPSPPVRSTVRGNYRELSVVTAVEMAGAAVTVLRQGKPLTGGALKAEGRVAGARFTLPLPPDRQPLGLLDVMVDGSLLARTERMGAAAMVGRALREAKLGFTQHVFSGSQFPHAEFQNPKAVQQLLGPVQVRTRFYDREQHEVSEATTPGRYGAVVEVTTDSTRPARRFFTLFRAPDSQRVQSLAVPYWALPKMDDIQLPGGVTLTTRGPGYADGYTQAAALRLAAALEAGPDVDPATADRQWWIGFKRRFYGISDTPIADFTGPAPLTPADGPAHVLRMGTPADAGLSDGVIPALEQVMAKWQAANRGQGFAVCLARHDVVFFHRAYGVADGKPMTVDLPCRLTSLTKLITGLLVMTYVDRGLIDLDEDVARVLPALRRNVAAQSMPLTLRQLTTHTSGLSGHYGDEINDLSEVISDEYPYLHRPTYHLYNGVGYALSVEALETLTATPFQTLYRRHLLDPLGCDHTTVPNSHNGAYSTPLDLARIGTVLLRGTYGPHRFLSEANVRKMRPVRLTMILGDDTQKTWGIGIWGSDASRGFSDGSFGHGGASGAMIRVDPVHDLILTVTSREDRPYFDGSLRGELLRAIADHAR